MILISCHKMLFTLLDSSTGTALVQAHTPPFNHPAMLRNERPSVTPEYSLLGENFSLLSLICKSSSVVYFSTLILSEHSLLWFNFLLYFFKQRMEKKNKSLMLSTYNSWYNRLKWLLLITWGFLSAFYWHDKPLWVLQTCYGLSYQGLWF